GQVLGAVRAGVDYGHLAAADDMGAGAGEGERAGVLRHHPADPRRDGLGAAVAERHGAHERDHGWSSGEARRARKAGAARRTALSLSPQGRASGGMSVLLTSTT